MKKLLTFLCSICLIIPLAFTLSGCGEQPPAAQITMIQIHDAIFESEMPVIENSTFVGNLKYYNYKESSYNTNLLEWQQKFERQNVDTTEFMAFDSYGYNITLVGDERTDNYYYIKVFKFSTSEGAEMCKSNYDFGEDYEVKTYGNLVIVTNDLISDFAFNLIDNIET